MNAAPSEQQQKAKARELDKRLRSVQQRTNSDPSIEIRERTVYRKQWLPWTLLAFSWIGFGVYILVL